MTFSTTSADDAGNATAARARVQLRGFGAEGKDADAIAAGVLGGVDGHVGGFDQVLEAGQRAAGFVGGDADAGGDGDGRLGADNRLGGDGAADIGRQSPPVVDGEYSGSAVAIGIRPVHRNSLDVGAKAPGPSCRGKPRDGPCSRRRPIDPIQA